MGSATLRRWRSAARAAALVLAGALLVRRAGEVAAVRRCDRWSAARLASVSQGADVPEDAAGARRDWVVCVIPMYHERELAAETVGFWHTLVQAAAVDDVVFVTTVKEDEGSASTRALVADALGRVSPAEPRLRLVHCPSAEPFRAVQLNLAVAEARRRVPGGVGAARAWVGVYNADSRPQASTFSELRCCAAAEPGTRVYQQLVDYLVPGRPGAGWTAAGNSVLQTWWTRSHYFARNRRGSRPPRWRAATSPFSTFGHGEFIRLDLLDEIGGFPGFAYADGLLLGWICRLAGERIGLLASLDLAEVPRTAADLLTQQRAWMQGLLNFGATVRWARAGGEVSLRRAEVGLLRCQHQAIPLAWGLSTPAVAAGMAVAGARLCRREGTLSDVACVLALASYPVIPALCSRSPGASPGPWYVRAGAAAASWTVEGLAFWPAAMTRLRGGQGPPAKTPR